MKSTKMSTLLAKKPISNGGQKQDNQLLLLGLQFLTKTLQTKGGPPGKLPNESSGEKSGEESDSCDSGTSSPTTGAAGRKRKRNAMDHNEEMVKREKR